MAREVADTSIAGTVSACVGSGEGTIVDDPTRGEALFLITSIGLVDGLGPDYISPESHWLARKASALRLDADLTFTERSERIEFSMEDPMSVAWTNEAGMEIVGYADLPITWEEPTSTPNRLHARRHLPADVQPI